MSLAGLGALGDLNPLVQQQLPVLAAEAENEWTLLHGHPAGSLLPEREDTHTRIKGEGKPTATGQYISLIEALVNPIG